MKPLLLIVLLAWYIGSLATLLCAALHLWQAAEILAWAALCAGVGLIAVYLGRNR